MRRVLHVAVVWSVLAASASSAFAQDAPAPVPEPQPAPESELIAAPIPIPVPVPAAGTASPDLSPAPVALPAEPIARAPAARTPSASEVVKAILGLLVILVLAYLAGHPRVQELEEMLGLSQVVTAGFPFVLLGLIAHHPAIGILSDPVLAEIRPALPLGLGWIGFAIGFRFDVRRVESLPRGIGPTLLLTSLLPFAGIVGACGLILLITEGDGVGHGTFLRDAIILGTAGIIGVRAAAPTLEGSRGDRIAPLIQLQEGTAMIGLVVVAAFWRPSGPEVGWNLPGVAWLFVTLGIGTLLAALIYAVLSHFKTTAEVTLLMLGSICLSAGLSSYLRLSPVAVSFLAGALLFNFPGSWKEQVRLALVRLERPVYLVFLVIAGALWQPGAWQGWLLLLLFVPARLFGKIAGTVVVRQNRLAELSDEEQARIAVAPMGALAIAIVVNAQDLYVGSTVSWMVTTVIGGAIATEIAVHLIMRRLAPALSSGPPSSPSGLAPMPREDTPPPFRLPPRLPPERGSSR